ncbi:MAG: peptidoglycan-binding protein, partial [Pseudomonadota bacterium]
MADAKIFLNYRREDADIWADTVYRALTPRFEVFMDVDGQIPDGLPWAEWLDAQVRSCDALVALIGRRWVEAFDAKAADRAPDFVKREIETALALDIPVVPVLLSDAPMPEMERLPESVRPLFDRQARRIQRGPELDRGLTGLRDGLTASIRLKRDAAKDAAREAARRAGRRTTAADPNGPREVGSSRRALVLGGLALGGGAIAAATFWPRGAEQSASIEARPRPTPTLTTVEDPTVWRPSEAEIREAQSALARLGRYKGAVDGRWGDASQAALRAFQREAGLSPADGVLRKTTLAALRAAPTPAFTGVLKGHTGRVSSVAVTPDGSRALSGSYDTTLILWDLATGQALRTFEGHTSAVTSVALTPDRP